MKKFFVSMVCVVALLSLGCEKAVQPLDQKIEGVVVDVNYIAQGSSFNAQDIKKTIVRFEDGRIKAFEGISQYTFQKGKVNIITFDHFGKITSVEVR